MSRINTNIPSLVAARVLAQQQGSLQESLQRLSTGLSINRGADNPAGLIASEALRSEARGVTAALENASRAKTVLATAESALSEISNLLLELENLVGKSASTAGLASAETEANQLQIDSILDSINRIANTTQFNGKKLLNGSMAYTTSGVVSNRFSRLQVYGASVPNGAQLPVIVSVTQSAQTARVNLAAGASTGLTTAGRLSSTNNVAFSLAGKLGTQAFSFAGNTANSAIRNTINSYTSVTGVSASLSGQSLRFNSTGYGSDAFVTITTSSGVFGVSGGDNGPNSDFGRDAGVRINGQAAQVKGLAASVRSGGLDIALDLTTSFGTAVGSTTFYLTGGGADFAISPTLTTAGRASVGLDSVTTAALGDSQNGFISSLASGQANGLSSKNFEKAQSIIRAANNQVASLRGRLGAFERNTIDTTVNSLNVALENIQAADSAIRDTDFALETSRLTRAQILLQSVSQALSIANQAPSAVLSLLR